MILAESYLHRLNPVAIPLSDEWGIRWYGLAYLAGFIIAWAMIRWMSKSGRSPLPQAAVGDLLVYCVIGVLAGGRLGYVIFYRPELLMSFTSSPPWWELLAIHRGGMASHGGIIGVVIAMIIFSRRHQLPALHMIDMVALSCTPGLFLGRLANFVNGELWGKKLPDQWQSDPPWWSVKYPEEVQFTEIDFTTVQHHIGGQDTLAEGVVQALRSGDPLVTTEIVPQLTAWWPSQFIQAISDGPILFLVLALVWWIPRRPGVVSASFLMAYGFLRVFTEMIRQPDEGVHLIAGLQRGQLLSVGMILLGIIMVFICANRSVPRIGGLRPHNETD